MPIQVGLRVSTMLIIRSFFHDIFPFLNKTKGAFEQKPKVVG